MTSDSAAEATPWDAAAHAFAAWRDGDASAFNVLVRTLTPVLWHVSRSYGLAPPCGTMGACAFTSLLTMPDSLSRPT